MNSKIEEIDETDEQTEQTFVSNYLESHPIFAKQWFMKNMRTEIIGEKDLIATDREIQSEVLCNKCSKLFNDKQSSDAKQIESKDEDLLTASYAEMAKGGRNSVTSDLFHKIVECGSRKRTQTINIDDDEISSKQLEDREDMDDDNLFMKLIRDITNELDIDTLCHKILVNVCLLTASDRGSLFLAKGSRENRYLVAKLFDVTSVSLLKEALITAEQYAKIPSLPFGVGIAGHVALTKENVNIEDAYKDNRFNKDIDFKTGYHTKAIMCQPILNFSGEVIGVAECINKTTDCPQQSFTKRDEQVFKKYLTFCGIGLQNAQLFEMSVFEYKRNQLLLSLARSIFEETSSLDILIKNIMMKSQGLLQSDKCRVYLIDIDQQQFQEEYNEVIKQDSNKAKICRKFSRSKEIFCSVFELKIGSNDIIKISINDLKSLIDSSHIQYARQVATAGQTFKCNENSGGFDDRTKPTKCSKSFGIHCQNDWVLSVPIFNKSSKVIGISQLVKERGNQFNDVDISTLEAFSIFCGLGIHNCLVYERAMKLTAKQKVALEVLSYHASASLEEMTILVNSSIPESDAYGLTSFEFCDFGLDEMDTCLATVRMFIELNLINIFKIPYQVLCRWILSVKKNYRPVKYHNWRHALNVTQTMFAILTKGNMADIMNENDVLGLIVASLCHDLDHRGTTNSFQTKIGSALATLYGTSIMENHHFNHCILILNTEGNNIFQSLSPEDYKQVIHIIEFCILSTDLDQYFQKKKLFEELIKSGEKCWKESHKKDLLRGVLMTACDISATFKPWPIQKRVAEMVASEFFEQGDLERKKLNQMPSALMDRNRKNELPSLQVTFFEVVCLPIYKILSECWPSLTTLYSGCLENRSKWKQLAEESDANTE